jgi:murein L,D-transpeptidase YafK
MRRPVLVGLGGGALVAVLGVIAWDALKLGRRAPALVAPELRADRIIVEKGARRMSLLLKNGSEVASYRIALGSAPAGDKQQEGDGRTPEGPYTIDFKNARSRFHLSLRVSYPNAQDREAARQRGVTPGGDIMIHGLPRGLGALGVLHLERDWTDGCIAVTNAEIEEIWALVDTGTAIEIRP